MKFSRNESEVAHKVSSEVTLGEWYKIIKGLVDLTRSSLLYVAFSENNPPLEVVE